MAYWVDYFSANNLGIAIGIIGVLITIYTYVVTRQKRAISYKISDIALLETDAPTSLGEKVKVFFSERPVPRITKTTVWIWNSGNTTINSYDIAPNDPIRLHIQKGFEILNVELMFTSTKANNISVQPNANGVIIPKFDFIDQNQGMKFSILHTAKTKSIHIKGTIKGIKEIKQDYESIINIITTIIFIKLLPMLFAILFVLYVANKLLPILMIPSILFSVIIAIIYSVFIDRIEDYFARRRPPNSFNK